MQTELASLYNGLQATLLRYIKTKVPNGADAEDILQNTFIKAAANLDAANRPEKLHNWIFTVTRNSITDYYRKKSTSTHVAYEEDATQDTPEEEYRDVAKELDCCLMKFLKALPDEYRDILIDVELKGIKQKDLVEKYDLAYPSIRSRVQRGRDKLKGVLLNCCHIAWDNRGNVLEVRQKKGCQPSSSNNCSA